jgi:hypothetical protein
MEFDLLKISKNFANYSSVPTSDLSWIKLTGITN